MRIKDNAWGNRSQLGATARLLEDLKTGNRDGIGGNEDKPAGDVGNAFERNPLARRAADALSVGVSRQDEVKRLAEFLQGAEAEWGEPVISDDVKAKMNGGELYAAQKAIRLQRMGRSPAEVRSGFVEARGSVAGREIPARDVHFEKFAPIGEPSGKTVVVSPGYLETGRTFDEQVDQLCRLGHSVVVMDHQWAGQTEGKAGGIDSGYGIARDTAAVTAFAAQEARAEFGKDAEVVLLGNSMGAGPGGLGAALLNDMGEINLDGPPMPKGIDLVLQAPFFGATPSLLNAGLQGLAHVPVLNRVQLPGTGLPDITDDPRAERLGAQDMVLENIQSQLSAFQTAQPDLDDLMQRIRDGARPGGRVIIVGNRDDTLADSAKWQELKSLLGDQLDLRVFDGSDHVVSQARGQQERAVDAVQFLVG